MSKISEKLTSSFFELPLFVLQATFYWDTVYIIISRYHCWNFGICRTRLGSHHAFLEIR